MNSKDYRGDFFKKNDSVGSMYNYDINPLISNFSFYDFVRDNLNYSEEDLGGFVVITNKQYIVGYNSFFGKGSHLASYARVMKDLSGGGYITNQMDATYLALKCKKSYITARICYECKNNNISDIPIRSFGIHFDFSLLEDGITNEQFLMFKQFYCDYVEDIRLMMKLGINDFCIEFLYKDNKGNIKRNTSNNFEELYKYLSSNLTDISDLNDEKILNEYIEKNGGKK